MGRPMSQIERNHILAFGMTQSHLEWDGTSGFISVVPCLISDAIAVQDLDGRTLAWNPGAVRLYGWSEAEAPALQVCDRMPEGLRGGELGSPGAAGSGRHSGAVTDPTACQAGSVVEVSMTSMTLVKEGGDGYAIATTERESSSKPNQPMEELHGHSGQASQQ